MSVQSSNSAPYLTSARAHLKCTDRLLVCAHPFTRSGAGGWRGGERIPAIFDDIDISY